MDKKQKTIIDEMDEFRTLLIGFTVLRKKLIIERQKLTNEEYETLSSLFDAISIDAGKYGPLIKDVTGLETIHTSVGSEDIWNWALSPEANTLVTSALDTCIAATSRTIGKLKEDIKKGLRDKHGNPIEKPPRISTEPPKDTAEFPIQLFDALQFHPKVIEASRSCFIAGNYREATLNAFISLIDYIKETTELDLDGDDLMNRVFSFDYDRDLRRISKYPIISINELKTSSDRNEQQGFMFLCKGAASGIRNPKAHKLIPQSNPLHTLEYLAFASLLMKKVEEGTVTKVSPPRKRWDLERFLADTRERCEQEAVDTITKLYDFTNSNADSINWGTGASLGSFTFRKLRHGTLVSIYTAYSDGSIQFNFGEMKGKEVKEEVLESFRTKLNEIPNVKVPGEAISLGKFPYIMARVLTEADNLKNFQDAVLALCQQIESGEE